jgi:uncharacterized lipoprotein YddW (UPF0748 family)
MKPVDELFRKLSLGVMCMQFLNRSLGRVMRRAKPFAYSVVMLALLIATTLITPRVSAGGLNQHRAEKHALWAHPPDAGKTIESVREFVAKCKRANIDTIVMLVKGMNGETYWKSKRFPQTIAKGYENFDLLEHLTREAHAQGIRVDAWLVDFVEGENGAAFREHPEWAQLNPDGKTTATETLGVARRPYPYVWMCPAQRPGYVDQWLVPMFEEIASSYSVDSVHHDYVRYPGDVAPDSYCFCDYCLKHMPRYSMLSYESLPHERYRVQHVQERLEANWWSDPTMVPADWQQRDRREMADYFLNGRTMPGGPPDMRYFFYAYRIAQIDSFVREVREHVRKINPKIEVSAAVFKNPVQSARFIGQQWHEWVPWIDVYMPMTYRSHFAGTFESYLEHLTETTARQLEWIRHERPLYAGIATTYLYREEYKPFDDIRDGIEELRKIAAKDASSRARKTEAIDEAFALIRGRLVNVAPEQARELGILVKSVTANDGRDATATALDNLDKGIAQLRADPPVGFLPAEKFARAIEAARKANPDGIVIFAASSVTREKLWPTLEAAFKR